MSSAPGHRPRPPGFARQTTVRWVLRVVGVALLVGGAVAVVTGFVGFARGMDATTVDDGAMTDHMLRFVAGGLAVVVGGALANAGFAGAAARYGAGELAPVAKDAAAYLSDGEGVLGVGRTVDDDRQPSAAASAGRFCGPCGTARGADDRFCTGCGAAVG